MLHYYLINNPFPSFRFVLLPNKHVVQNSTYMRELIRVYPANGSSHPYSRKITIPMFHFIHSAFLKESYFLLHPVVFGPLHWEHLLLYFIYLFITVYRLISFYSHVLSYLCLFIFAFLMNESNHRYSSIAEKNVE